MTEFLFVYGTLRNPVIQRWVLGREVGGTADVLEGYTRSTIILGTGE
jgi:hypothetical protein